MARARETDEASVASSYAFKDLERYPWHESVWQRLTQDLERLPHALLFTGPTGLAKTTLALRMARLLACETPVATQEACGTCSGCRLFAAGTHPDLLYVFPQTDSGQISIDQVRELIGFLALKPHAARRRVIVLSPADAMNSSAANSLLKSLEEPPGGLLMLVTGRPARLPATIRSRCVGVTLHVPPADEAVAWLAADPRRVPDPDKLLALAGGAPQRALELFRSDFLALRETMLADVESLLAGRADPVACAQRWKATDSHAALSWFFGALADMIRLATMRNEGGFRLENPDLGARLQRLANPLDLRSLHDLTQKTSETITQLSSLDEQLLLEELLIRTSRLGRQSSGKQARSA